MKNSIFYSHIASLAVLTLLALSVNGCGGGGTNNYVTVRGAVLSGSKSAVANPTGADGLTPVGAGVAIRQVHLDTIEDSFATLPTLHTDAQGHFTVRMGPDGVYYYDIPNQCSTTDGAVLDHGAVVSSYNSGYDDGHWPSDAMNTKAQLAAKALGVDVVVIIGTDADSCTQPTTPTKSP